MPSLASATIEDLAAIPGRAELIDGEIISMAPAGDFHGHIEAGLIVCLGTYLRQHRLGRCYSGDTGFIISRDPDTVLCPDVGVVLNDRLSAPPGPGFVTAIPHLVVEVVSPSDAWGEVEAKAQRWLDAGVLVVWVVSPRTYTVMAFSVAGVRRFGHTETLDGAPVLPGFTLAVADIFA